MGEYTLSLGNSSPPSASSAPGEFGRLEIESVESSGSFEGSMSGVAIRASFGDRRSPFDDGLRTFSVLTFSLSELGVGLP